MTLTEGTTRSTLLRRSLVLEYVTLGWNVVGIAVLPVAAIAARSVALAGFGLDSLIEIGASTVVIWELADTGGDRQERALRLISIGFAVLALYLAVQSTWVIASGFHPHSSSWGIAWTAVTAAVMFALAAGKARLGTVLGNPVLKAEGRVTFIDGLLAAAVLAGLLGNALAGWWWADPATGYVTACYAGRETKGVLPRRPKSAGVSPLTGQSRTPPAGSGPASARICGDLSSRSDRDRSGAIQALPRTGQPGGAQASRHGGERGRRNASPQLPQGVLLSEQAGADRSPPSAAGKAVVMCRRVTCSKCGKATYAGCGNHVDQVLAGVPKAQRCSCPPAAKRSWWPFGGR